MKSMTGYGSSKSHSEQADIEVSLKTVNGRFLDLRIHSPREYSHLDSQIRSTLKKSLLRGTVDIYINRKPLPKAVVNKLDVNWKLAEELNKVCGQLKKKLKIAGDVDLSVFVRNTDIIKIQEETVVKPSEKKQLMDTLSEAAALLDKERMREGQSLQKDLLSHHKGLGDLVTQLKAARTQNIGQIQKKIEERLKVIEEKFAAEPGRLAQEVSVLVDKTDIAEELARLGEHLKAFKVEMGKKGSIGKKLDFYTQEILREVNTIGSKSQSSELTQLVVNAKSVVEKIREQVQNVE